MGKVPNQIITWMHHNVGDLRGPHDPQFLYALRDTHKGDRQIVWEGGGGRGLIAVVDFDDAHLRVNGRWRSWGVVTPLNPPIGAAELRDDPVLATRFSGNGLKALHGLPKQLPVEHGKAIEGLAHGLPDERLPNRAPHAGDPVDDWFGSVDIDPEKTFELAVHTSRRLWKRIGFPQRPAMQQRLAPTPDGDVLLIPDLIAPGVVGEVKRSLRPNDGPAQVARYLKRLNETRGADGPWRGILIHGGDLSPAVRQRLHGLRCDIQVWAVIRGKVREWKAVQQYP